MLRRCGLAPRRVGVPTECQGVIVLKPHGSIDFAMRPGLISVGPTTYPLHNWITLNDAPIVALPTSELRRARQEAYVVLPTEYSPYLDFQWVRPGYSAWQRDAHNFSHCIFLGLSDWECDRAELDLIWKSLDPDARIIVANPKPPSSFVERIASSGRDVVTWLDGPEDLPV